MANRAYLYSVDRLPNEQVNREDLRIEAVAEFAYDIPLAYLILVSGNPQRVPSLVWDGVEAVAGDFDEGLRRLIDFLESIPHPNVQHWKQQAHVFLTQDRVQQQFFLLEVDEIFGMGGDEWDADDPIEDLLNYAAGIESVLRAKCRNLGGDNPDVSAEAVERELHSWGLSSFAHVLYHDFSVRTEEDTRGRLTREEIREMAAVMVGGWQQTEEGRIQLEQLKPRTATASKGRITSLALLGFFLMLPGLMVLSGVFLSPWLFPIAILAFVAYLHFFSKSEGQ